MKSVGAGASMLALSHASGPSILSCRPDIALSAVGVVGLTAIWALLTNTGVFGSVCLQTKFLSQAAA